MAACDVPIIASQISLSTKSFIRYTGTLYHIDINESAVTLKGVRSFGTEARPTHRYISPSPSTYEFITFSGPESADLHVIVNAALTAPPRPVAVAVAPQEEDITEAEGDEEKDAEKDAEEVEAEGKEEGEEKAPLRKGETQEAAKEASTSTGLRHGTSAGRASSGGMKRWGPPPSAAMSNATVSREDAVLTLSSGGPGSVSGGAVQNEALSSDAVLEMTTVANGVCVRIVPGGWCRQRAGGEGRKDGIWPSDKDGGKKDSGAPKIVVPEEAFDFEEMNAKFD